MLTTKTIEERIAEHFRKRMYDALTLGACCDAMTAQVEGPTTLTTAKIQTLLGEWANFSAQMRRSRFTVVVRNGYEGDAIIEQTPTEGTFCEMSWRQARHLHWHHCPLILAEVIDEDTAHFRPASAFDMFVPMALPMPPYEIPAV